LSESEKQNELPELIQYYMALCERSKKQFDLGVKRLSEVYEKAYKIDKQTTINLFDKVLQGKHIGHDMVRLEKIRGWLYILRLFFFSVAVSITVFIILTLGKNPRLQAKTLVSLLYANVSQREPYYL
jgi:hypothetical protein